MAVTISETCCCGATFALTSTRDDIITVRHGAEEWRKQHQHPASLPRRIRPRPALVGRKP